MPEAVLVASGKDNFSVVCNNLLKQFSKKCGCVMHARWVGVVLAGQSAAWDGGGGVSQSTVDLK